MGQELDSPSGPGLWDLNGIVLCHLSRFFQAAIQVVREWRDPDRDLVGALLTLSGNMLWARSGFEAADVAQEQQMAYGGAVIGSVAGRALDASGSAGRERALALLDRLERELRRDHDALLELLVDELGRLGLLSASPARTNAAIWALLFPRFPFEESQGELCARIARELAGGAAAPRV